MELDSQYELIGPPIGAGSFGEVFKATDTNSGDIVAIKQMKVSKREDALSEIRKARKVPPHPNIVKILDVSERTLRVVMEFCDCDLDHHYSSQLVPARESIRIAIQCVCGIEYMHQKGLVHRDLKPANIMLKDGVVKITDFGLANIDAMDKNIIDSMYSMSTVCGTPCFMAPEMRRKGYTNSVDIYSMGLVIEWMNYIGELEDEFLEVGHFMASRDPKLRPKAKVARENLESLNLPPEQRTRARENRNSTTYSRNIPSTRVVYVHADDYGHDEDVLEQEHDEPDYEPEDVIEQERDEPDYEPEDVIEQEHEEPDYGPEDYVNEEPDFEPDYDDGYDYPERDYGDFADDYGDDEGW